MKSSTVQSQLLMQLCNGLPYPYPTLPISFEVSKHDRKVILLSPQVHVLFYSPLTFSDNDIE